MNVLPDDFPTGHAGIDARLQKGPQIHPTAWVVPGANIVGDVTLEQNQAFGMARCYAATSIG